MERPLSEQYASFLHDESRLRGEADAISFPRAAEEAREIVRRCLAAGKPMTAQGSRTGICGGAAPRV